MTGVLLWPVWWTGVVFSAVTGWAYGWLPMNVSWFSVVPPGDPLVSAGGYGMGALVMLAAAAAIEAFDGPHNARRLSVGLSGLYAFCALHAAFVINTSSVGAWNALSAGMVGVTMTPWTLFHLGAGLVGAVVVVWRNVREGRLDDGHI